MADLARKPGWQAMLNAHLAASRARYAETGLAWGEFDCCVFAFDWVREATGVDPMAAYRGRYASRDEALALLRETGDGTLSGALAAFFGAPVAPSQARRGDVAFRADEKAVGIVVTQGARQMAAFLAEQGVVLLPIEACDGAFRVGD